MNTFKNRNKLYLPILLSTKKMEVKVYFIPLINGTRDLILFLKLKTIKIEDNKIIRIFSKITIKKIFSVKISFYYFSPLINYKMNHYSQIH